MYLDSLTSAHDLSNQGENGDLNFLVNKNLDDRNKTQSNKVDQFENEQDRKNGKNELKNIIESANDGVQVFNKSIEFTIHEETNKIMIKIVDNETGEVLKEIPAEKILDMVAKFCEMAGILVDEKI